MNNIYDEVAAEALGDYHDFIRGVYTPPDYRDMIWEWADEPFFSHSDVPLHVYEDAEITDQPQEAIQ